MKLLLLAAFAAVSVQAATLRGPCGGNPFSAGRILHGTSKLSGPWTGSKCQTVSFDKGAFEAGPVRVLGTVRHPDASSTIVHRALYTWVQNADANGFRWCVREIRGGKPHDAIAFDYVAFDGAAVGGKGRVSGTINVPSFHNTRCEVVKTGLPANSPVLAMTNHRRAGVRPTHQPLTTWAEAHDGQVRICFRESDEFDRHHAPVDVDYLAWEQKSISAESGVSIQKSTWRNTVCNRVKFEKEYSDPPHVVALANHFYHKVPMTAVHDAVLLWAEDVTTTGFRWCASESAAADMFHAPIAVSWLAL